MCVDAGFALCCNGRKKTLDRTTSFILAFPTVVSRCSCGGDARQCVRGCASILASHVDTHLYTETEAQMLEVGGGFRNGKGTKRSGSSTRLLSFSSVHFLIWRVLFLSLIHKKKRIATVLCFAAAFICPTPLSFCFAHQTRVKQRLWRFFFGCCLPDFYSISLKSASPSLHHTPGHLH